VNRANRAGVGAPHRVRIVGGAWKRTPLKVPDLPGLRPTPDRVRETLFNWLGQSLDGRHCLDAFAGTGALGLEAASRGAARVLMIERDRIAARAIVDTVTRLGALGRVELVVADAFAEIDRRVRAGEQFDLVFLDPPFDGGLALRMLERLSGEAQGLLAPGALVYVEDDAPMPPPPGFELLRADRAGHVHYHLFSTAIRPAAEDPAADEQGESR
jgi:16S rRNA (guanine966-N2)-methyltransferase